MKIKSTSACALLLVASLFVTTAYADDKAVIDYRQSLMKTLSEQSGAIGQILSGAAPDDQLIEHLDALALTASIALKSFRPKVAGGEAKADVWKNWPDFEKRMNDFAQKTSQTALTAKDRGKDAVGEMIIEALSCKGCHDIYRDERKK